MAIPVRERRLSPGRRRRLHWLHRLHHLRLSLRLSRLSIELRHRSRFYRWLLELGLRHLIRWQRMRILHRLRRRRRVLIGHRSRLLVDRLALLYRLVLVLNGWLLLWLLLQLLRRLRLPVGWLRLRHRRGKVLAVVVHTDSGILSGRLVGGD